MFDIKVFRYAAIFLRQTVF